MSQRKFFNFSIKTALSKKFPNFAGFQREALTEWAEFTKLSMCGVGHYAFESIALNIGIIVSGTVNATLMAAQGILHQFETLLYMVRSRESFSRVPDP